MSGLAIYLTQKAVIQAMNPPLIDPLDRFGQKRLTTDLS